MATVDHECKSFYENSYESSGFGAQRRYPNEELMRFMGRAFFSVPREQRKGMRILEVGCGSGGNLWAIAREGFDTYGIDLSAEGINLCNRMLEAWGCSATLQVGDMADLPYEARFFDAVVDVFSSNCLPEKDFHRYLDDVSRVLKPAGKYFSYTPSKNSDVFKETASSDRIDPSTLNGIRRPTAPFYGNFYPFRFMSRDEYAALLAEDFTVTYSETVGRTYRSGQEYFEFVVVQAERK
ncbi:MAG: class I SAM-dependent methyltransferase [Candidatus Acidiferrales bacterium]